MWREKLLTPYWATCDEDGKANVTAGVGDEGATVDYEEICEAQEQEWCLPPAKRVSPRASACFRAFQVSNQILIHGPCHAGERRWRGNVKCEELASGDLDEATQTIQVKVLDEYFIKLAHFLDQILVFDSYVVRWGSKRYLYK